ncbi:hypothetical protein NQF78_16640 [Pseudomonas monsensis]|uniref:Uncharacterized protein n=1 Tax=Pseudomonas monsensis TaxID=2745509 RepID=A0ABT3YWQ6_9PSED|nr:hypothetical protein [Pseudomonas monsensis]MCY0109942.1 hypothetical protein [Pseudomonas monsensis]
MKDINHDTYLVRSFIADPDYLLSLYAQLLQDGEATEINLLDEKLDVFLTFYPALRKKLKKTKPDRSSPNGLAKLRILQIKAKEH